MNMAQVSIGGKDVLVPVTTIGSLATGAAVTSTLQPWRSLDSGEPCTYLSALNIVLRKLATPQYSLLFRSLQQPARESQPLWVAD